MRRWSIVLAFVFCGAAVVLPTRALAGLHFCNKTGNAVTLAIATYDYGRAYTAPRLDHVEGWWTIEPGQCKTPIGRPLDARRNGRGSLLFVYMYYAYSSTNIWNGNTAADKEGTRYYCVDPAQAFDTWQDGWDSDTASRPGQCAPGVERQYFRPIYEANDHRTDSTVNLVE